MRPQDNFNIITGEVKTHHPINSTSKRFASLDMIKNQKISGGYNYNLPPMKKLGEAKDAKLFHYTYTNKDHNQNIYSTIAANSHIQPTRKTLSQNRNQNILTTQSLINATKLDYNIVNNSIDPRGIATNPTNWSQTKKHCPVSKFSHMGRQYAPNLSKEHSEKLSANEFSRKKNMCSEVCQIQRTYGTQKFFRKFK